MKHFWVIFKLMLLLVFALRLLKSNRKVTKYEHDPNRGFFNLFQEKTFSEKINIQLESATPELQLKEIFRKNIRPKEENWQKNGNHFDDFFAWAVMHIRQRAGWDVDVRIAAPAARAQPANVHHLWAAKFHRKMMPVRQSFS